MLFHIKYSDKLMTSSGLITYSCTGDVICCQSYFTSNDIYWYTYNNACNKYKSYSMLSIYSYIPIVTDIVTYSYTRHVYIYIFICFDVYICNQIYNSIKYFTSVYTIQ